MYGTVCLCVGVSRFFDHTIYRMYGTNREVKYLVLIRSWDMVEGCDQCLPEVGNFRSFAGTEPEVPVPAKDSVSGSRRSKHRNRNSTKTTRNMHAEYPRALGKGRTHATTARPTYKYRMPQYATARVAIGLTSHVSPFMETLCRHSNQYLAKLILCYTFIWRVFRSLA